jgi:addiction module HigA family antidote
MLPKNRQPSHPGEILLKDFLEPMSRTQQDFAKHLNWTYAKVNEIVNGKRGVSEEAALCFADAFGSSPQTRKIKATLNPFELQAELQTKLAYFHKLNNAYNERIQKETS